MKPRLVPRGIAAAIVILAIAVIGAVALYGISYVCCVGL